MYTSVYIYFFLNLWFATLPGNVDPVLYAVDGLVEVAEETVDVPELAVGGGSGSSLHQVVGDHQPLLEANLDNSYVICFAAKAIALLHGIRCNITE